MRIYVCTSISRVLPLAFSPSFPSYLALPPLLPPRPSPFSAPSAAIFFFSFFFTTSVLPVTRRRSNERQIRREKIIKDLDPDSTLATTIKYIYICIVRKIFLHRFLTNTSPIIDAIVIRYTSGIIPWRIRRQRVYSRRLMFDKIRTKVTKARRWFIIDFCSQTA